MNRRIFHLFFILIASCSFYVSNSFAQKIYKQTYIQKRPFQKNIARQVFQYNKKGLITSHLYYEDAIGYGYRIKETFFYNNRDQITKHIIYEYDPEELEESETYLNECLSDKDSISYKKCLQEYDSPNVYHVTKNDQLLGIYSRKIKSKTDSLIAVANEIWLYGNYKSPKGSKPYDEVYKYDERGNLIVNEMYFDKKDRSHNFHIQYYEYDDKNRVTKKTSKFNIFHGNDGNLTFKPVIDSFINVWNEQKLLSRTEYYTQQVVKERNYRSHIIQIDYKYNRFGHVVREKYYFLMGKKLKKRHFKTIVVKYEYHK